MIQWNHSEPIEWAQITSNYEETTYHAEKVMFDHSQKEEIKSPGTGEKTDKMAATKPSQAKPSPEHAQKPFCMEISIEKRLMQDPSVLRNTQAIN